MELPELVDQLTGLDDEAAAVLIHRHHIGQETLWSLKNESARFYVTQPAEALRVAQAAMRLSLLLNTPAPGRWILANALVFLERYAEAATLYSQARAEFLAEGRTLDAARMAVGHVFVLAYTGQAAQALELAAVSEPLLEASAQVNPEDQARLGNLLLNLGVALDLSDQFEASLSVYARLDRLAAETDNPLLRAQARHNLAYASSRLNLFDEALASYQHAETIFHKEAAHVDLARLYTNKLLLLAAMQRPGEVEHAYRQAAEALAHLEDRTSQLQSLTLIRGLATLQMGTAPDDDLIAALEEAREAFQRRASRVEEGQASYVLGRLYLVRGRHEAANVVLNAAQALAQQNDDSTLAYQARYGLALLAMAEARSADALALLWEAVYAVEATRHNIGADLLRSGYLLDKRAVYQELAALLAACGRTDEAFDVVERAKARLITEKLAFRLQTTAARLAAGEDDAEVRALLAALGRQLSALETHYRQAQHAQLASDQVVAAPLPATTGAVAELERSVQQTVRQVQRRRPSFLAWEACTTLDVQQVQQTLGSAAFIQYTQHRGRVQAYVVTHTGREGPVDLGHLASVGQMLQHLRTAVERTLGLAIQVGTERLQRYLPALLADAQQILAQLYAQLLQPLAPWLVPAQPLIVAPDDILYYVPFHALYDGTRYVVEEHTVSYTPNATVRAMCLHHRRQPRSALLAGHDATGRLPHVAQEIAGLADLLGATHGLAVDTMLGAAATAAWVRQRGHQYDVLHLAAHAHFRVDDPMLSAIYLADRPLTMAEMAVAELHAEQVTLSGCETGRGELHGADLLSLASTFLSAGARSLLVTLWRADDQVTSRMVQHFYQAWLGGAPRAEAIRQAQVRELEAAARLPERHHVQHPAFWAPFVLIGE